MKSSLREKAAILRIVEAYMDSLVRRVRIEGVPDLKRNYQIPRSTFYRYYASLEDLELNFLDNYYDLVVGRSDGRFRSYSDLSDHYVNIWTAVRRSNSFFAAVLKTTEFPDLRVRWLGKVTTNVRRYIPPRHLLSLGSDLDPHMEFALGVVEQFVVLCLDTDEEDVGRLIRLMHEYMWGGFQRLEDPYAQLRNPVEVQLTLEFQRRIARTMGRSQKVQLV